MVVTGKRKHAAVPVGSRGIRLTKDVAGAIDTRCFSVPDAEDAIIFRRPANAAFSAQFLAAPDSRCTQFLVNAGFEDHVASLQVPVCAHQFGVISCEGRTAIS